MMTKRNEQQPTFVSASTAGGSARTRRSAIPHEIETGDGDSSHLSQVSSLSSSRTGRSTLSTSNGETTASKAASTILDWERRGKRNGLVIKGRQPWSTVTDMINQCHDTDSTKRTLVVIVGDATTAASSNAKKTLTDEMGLACSSLDDQAPVVMLDIDSIMPRRPTPALRNTKASDNEPQPDFSLVRNFSRVVLLLTGSKQPRKRDVVKELLMAHGFPFGSSIYIVLSNCEDKMTNWIRDLFFDANLKSYYVSTNFPRNIIDISKQTTVNKTPIRLDPVEADPAASRALMALDRTNQQKSSVMECGDAIAALLQLCTLVVTVGTETKKEPGLWEHYPTKLDRQELKTVQYILDLTGTNGVRDAIECDICCKFRLVHAIVSNPEGKMSLALGLLFRYGPKCGTMATFRPRLPIVESPWMRQYKESSYVCRCAAHHRGIDPGSWR